MGRAIVREPKVFLFDEPLSNLDAKLRVQMRFEIQKLHRQLGTTSLYVTHDQVEAMTLAHRMIVMNAGRRRADRLADGRLRGSGDALRRRVHRLAVDELPRRARARAAGKVALEHGGIVALRATGRSRPGATSSSASGPST